MPRGAYALVLVCCFGCDSDASGVNGALRPDAATGMDASSPDAARPSADAGRVDADGGSDAGRAGASGRAGGGSGGGGGAADGGGGWPAIDAGGELDAGEPEAMRVQIFSRTVGYRHDSIEPARAALSAIAARRNAVVESTEDPAQLISRLAATDVVVFLMTTGDVLDSGQQAQFEAFIRAGGGFVGVHSAADTEYDWPFYRELNGAWFQDHPAIQPAKIVVEAGDDPIVSFLPSEWIRTDEWYNFRDNPRSRATVLLRLDESSYSGGSMGADHPIAWKRTIDRGRAFYTGLGHTRESWAEPLLLRHVEEALSWAAGR